MTYQSECQRRNESSLFLNWQFLRLFLLTLWRERGNCQSYDKSGFSASEGMIFITTIRIFMENYYIFKTKLLLQISLHRMCPATTWIVTLRAITRGRREGKSRCKLGGHWADTASHSNPTECQSICGARGNMSLRVCPAHYIQVTIGYGHLHMTCGRFLG